MIEIYRLANRHAGKLLLLGLAAVAGYNWWRWQKDKALLAERARPEPMPDWQAWPELPTVSVLVAAWNEAGIVQEHVESFLRLRYPNKELILCAGGPDGTYEMAHRYAGEQVTVLEQHPGEGKQAALRCCLARATGEIVFLTDADCLLDDGAFERTLAPIVNESEVVATGVSRPLSEQRAHPFVLHRWFIEVGGVARWGRYTDGILGGNVALRRDVLETVGDFEADVRTGTDYYLAKQILSRGYSIRHVADSTVATRYAETTREYWRQQTRWLRNVVMHGLRFRAYGEVVRCLVPSVLGALMLTGPLFALGLGRVVLTGWLLAWLHVFLSRLRYVWFGEHVTGCPFPLGGYPRLPLYILADFIIWTSTLLQYFSKPRRSRW